jgi:general secretion pathway protein G
MRALRRSIRERGFSLVELVIVMTVLLILLAILVPSYQAIMRQAREDTLKQDLQTMRKAIDQYTADKEKAPQSLEEVVNAGYISEIPEDPMTGSSTTWEVILEEESISLTGQAGIRDVKSGSQEMSSSGEDRYSDW